MVDANRPNFANPLCARFPYVRLRAIGGVPIRELEQMRAIIGRLDKHHVSYSMHGTPDAGSIYVRDPDEILVELTTGY